MRANCIAASEHVRCTRVVKHVLGRTHARVYSIISETLYYEIHWSFGKRRSFSQHRPGRTLSRDTRLPLKIYAASVDKLYIIIAYLASSRTSCLNFFPLRPLTAQN